MLMPPSPYQSQSQEPTNTNNITNTLAALSPTSFIKEVMSQHLSAAINVINDEQCSALNETSAANNEIGDAKTTAVSKISVTKSTVIYNLWQLLKLQSLMWIWWWKRNLYNSCISIFNDCEVN
jgi:hypothetical protein